jgi:hypothetical protein
MQLDWIVSYDFGKVFWFWMARYPFAFEYELRFSDWICTERFNFSDVSIQLMRSSVKLFTPRRSLLNYILVLQIEREHFK